MVFFTCQHCGASLKKNTVEKHYMTECRNRSPNLTCVDCLKDFLGDAYVAHTSCMTEDEKYSAKGFKSKPPSDKGAKKQVSWMSTIQEIQVPSSMSAFQKKVIHRSQNSPNVPQKRLKFQNFCKSNFGKFADIKQIDEVFDLFERAHKKSVDDSNNEKSGTSNNSPAKDIETNGNKSHTNVDKSTKVQNTETNEDEDGDVKMENGDVKMKNDEDKSKKLSKKEKKDLKRKAKLAAKLNGNNNQDTTDLETSNILENCENENIENETINGNDTKADSSMDVENGQCVEEATEKHLSKKEKKKLKKQEKFQAQLNEIEQAQMATDDIDNENNSDENKTHKKKKRKADTNGVIENGSKKSKKRNREDCGMDIDEEQPVKKSKDSETHENGNSDTTENNVNGKQQFDWSDIIVQVLQSRKDKELPIKRLAKKVITEYQANYATYETFEKISAKFHKKLKKIPGVKVLHDKAKLVTADE
ncbi:hypothetical protein LSTR_LSTR001082 [Laodelphax striatellus]|uniref:Uncharacterized protein n=1 Tax=Laodelphax striatellus TaxID=195883 RepID=A0A482X2T2_LAOST|nr:hypothetical protein LSTR_LSTR001082 [Laodelphax striatellus]